MNKYTIALLLLLIPSVVSGATYYASPTGSGTTCSEGSPCALQYTLETKATGGDTVICAAGTYTEDDTISITAGMTVTGAGIDSSIISCAADTPCISVTPANDTNNFEISGFTISGGATLDTTSGNNGQQLITVSGATANPFTKLKIHDIKFTKGYVGLNVRGQESGVAYSNQFVDNYIHVRSVGAGDAGWSWDSTQGGANYVFVENNTFTNSGTEHTDGFAFEGGQGGRVVFRFNTLSLQNGTGGTGEVFDLHGDQGSRGTVAAEIYNNSITLVDGTKRLLNHRGGKVMFFKNAVVGSYDGYMRMTEYQGWAYCDADSYPKVDQINSAYYYSNTSKSVAISPALSCPNDNSCECYEGYGTCNKPTTNYCSPAQNDSTYIQENRDYYLTTKAGYSPYTCPHPLAGSGSCDSTVKGTGGYSLVGNTFAPWVH